MIIVLTSQVSYGYRHYNLDFNLIVNTNFKGLVYILLPKLYLKNNLITILHK